MGSTPFGELSGSTTLTFVQKDAMVRNAALASLNTTVNYTLALMEGYNTLSEGAGESLHVKSFLPPDQVRAADGAGCVCLGGGRGRGRCLWCSHKTPQVKCRGCCRQPVTHPSVTMIVGTNLTVCTVTVVRTSVYRRCPAPALLVRHPNSSAVASSHAALPVLPGHALPPAHHAAAVQAA